MNLFIFHNCYAIRGGEEAVFLSEKNLLEKHNTINTFIVDNKDVAASSSLNHAFSTFWSFKVAKSIQAILKEKYYSIAHFHNIFPLISPSAYYAAHRNGVPVVQTLHNYRLICPNALFLREGKVCEDCLGKTIPYPALLHSCYRRSFAATAVTVAMLVFHRLLGTWRNQVDVYIALTEFARQKFIQGGLPAEKIVVKPNFIDPDPGERSSQGDYALFVGRLAVEKGVSNLLAAWQHLPDVPLKIAGDGPLLDQLRAQSEALGLRQVEFLGRRDHDSVIDLMKGARFIVFPSVYYEGFPVTIVEAFACGLPVIASRLGAMQEIIQHGRTGLHFTPADPQDLAQKVREAWSNPGLTLEMGHNARAEYDAKYTAERNYQMLMQIYQTAIERNRARKPSKFLGGITRLARKQHL